MQIIPLKEMKTRNLGIDLFKGILLILVIYVHITDLDWRWKLDGFLLQTIIIPLFLGVSGHNINHEFIEQSNYRTIFKKFYSRMIKIWIITVLIFFFMDLIFGLSQFHLIDLIYIFVFPEYHLWYILALFVYISTIWLFKKFKISDNLVLLYSLIMALSVVLYYDYNYNWTSWVETAIYLKYKPHYFIFFVLGYIIRTDQIKKDSQATKITKGFIVSVLLYRILSFTLSNPAQYFTTFDFYLLNFALLVYLIPFFEKLHLKSVNFVNMGEDVQIIEKLNLMGKIFSPLIWIGKNSLYIYLWHAIFQYLL